MPVAIFRGWATARSMVTDSTPPKAAATRVARGDVRDGRGRRRCPACRPARGWLRRPRPRRLRRVPAVNKASADAADDDGGVDGDLRPQLVDGVIDGVGELVQRLRHLAGRLREITQPAPVLALGVTLPEHLERVDRLTLVVVDERRGRVVDGRTYVIDGIGERPPGISGVAQGAGVGVRPPHAQLQQERPWPRPRRSPGVTCGRRSPVDLRLHLGEHARRSARRCRHARPPCPPSPHECWSGRGPGCRRPTRWPSAAGGRRRRTSCPARHRPRVRRAVQRGDQRGQRRAQILAPAV